MCVSQLCPTLGTPWTVTHQTLLCMDLPRQDTGVGSVPFSSVAQSCPALCNPMNCSTPGLPVHHQLPEFTQTHVHRVADAIQPSHPLLSPSPQPSILPSIRAFQMSQLFASGGQSIVVSASTSVLPMNTQDWSPLGWTSWISLQSKGLSRVYSAFFIVQFSHPYMTTGKTIALTRWTFVGKVIFMLFFF